MLINSFCPLVLISLGEFTIKQPTRKENGITISAKTIIQKYTGIFYRSHSTVDKLYILKSETSESVLVPLYDDIIALPFYDLSSGSYSEPLPDVVVNKLNRLFSSVSEENENGVSVIGLYHSGFISDNTLHSVALKQLTALNASLDDSQKITITLADAIKYSSLALAAKQGLVRKESDNHTITLQDRIKQLQAEKQKLLNPVVSIETKDATNEALLSENEKLTEKLNELTNTPVKPVNSRRR